MVYLLIYCIKSSLTCWGIILVDIYGTIYAYFLVVLKSTGVRIPVPSGFRSLGMEPT